MLKTIKQIAVAFAIVSILISTSCKNDPVEEPRTPEIESAELDAALRKLEVQGFDVDTTDLGIYYVVSKTGEGPLAQAGDTLKFEYTGYLLNRDIFDASIDHYPNGIWEFIYKSNKLIPGFNDGISVMNKGAEIEMYIPSKLAYGATGYGKIKPYSTLIFAAKMRDLKPKQH